MVGCLHLTPGNIEPSNSIPSYASRFLQYELVALLGSLHAEMVLLHERLPSPWSRSGLRACLHAGSLKHSNRGQQSWKH